MAGELKSYARITRADLKRLLAIARLERDDFFARHKEYAILYRKRVLCTALCGTGALHYINGQSGIESFEVWTFYAQHPEASFPHWHEERYDYGTSRKFGRLRGTPDTFKGRPVILAGRSIEASPVDDPIEALQHYLRRGNTPVARRLAEKAVWPSANPKRSSRHKYVRTYVHVKEFQSGTEPRFKGFDGNLLPLSEAIRLLGRCLPPPKAYDRNRAWRVPPRPMPPLRRHDRREDLLGPAGRPRARQSCLRRCTCSFEWGPGAE